MQTRGILAAISAVLVLVVVFFGYGVKVAGDTRAKVVARQVQAPVDGDDCVVFDRVEELGAALSKVRPAEARFLQGEEVDVGVHRDFVFGLGSQIDAFLATRSCARVVGRITAPAHWEEWIVLVRARATLHAAGRDPVAAMTDLENLWRLGHVLQSDFATWNTGADLIDDTGPLMLALLEGTSVATHEVAIERVDKLSAELPNLHQTLDHAVYTAELDLFDEGAGGLMAGVTGVGLAQAVGVFHPVYDRYVALRGQQWSEREPLLADWQTEVDGYAHPIYARLQGGAVLAFERDAAVHRARLEMLRIAVRMARFGRTYGACPTDFARLELDALEQPFGPYELDGCLVRSPEGPTGALELRAR